MFWKAHKHSQTETLNKRKTDRQMLTNRYATHAQRYERKHHLYSSAVWLPCLQLTHIYLLLCLSRSLCLVTKEIILDSHTSICFSQYLGRKHTLSESGRSDLNARRDRMLKSAGLPVPLSLSQEATRTDTFRSHSDSHSPSHSIHTSDRKIREIEKWVYYLPLFSISICACVYVV